MLARIALLVLCSICGWGAAMANPFLVFGESDEDGEPRLYADAGVVVERADGESAAYRMGMTLSPGDLVRTSEGQAVIEYGDGHVVAINTNTTIRLGSIELFLGEIFTRLKQLTRRGGGRVVTDEVAASVSGTEFSVTRLKSSDDADVWSSVVVVRDGLVTCEPGSAASWRSVRLGADQMLRTGTGTAHPEVTRVDAAALTSWADAVIERLLGSDSDSESGSSGFSWGIGFGINTMPAPSAGGDRPHQPPAERMSPERNLDHE